MRRDRAYRVVTALIQEICRAPRLAAKKLPDPLLIATESNFQEWTTTSP